MLSFCPAFFYDVFFVDVQGGMFHFHLFYNLFNLLLYIQQIKVTSD